MLCGWVWVFFPSLPSSAGLEGFFSVPAFTEKIELNQ